VQPLKDLGYDAIWQGQKSWNGVAILSRVGEIEETRAGCRASLRTRRAATSKVL
jgi:exonuclease III